MKRPPQLRGLRDRFDARIAAARGVRAGAVVNDAAHDAEQTCTDANASDLTGPAASYVESSSPFDRELEQYRLAEILLTERVRELEVKMAQCRDGGDLLADYRRHDSQCRQLKAQLAGLVVSRNRYVVDRDRLAAWGSTDDWVVAGSIVTVKYLSGDRDTFVLTERPVDTEYATVSYSSPMGRAVRRRKVGDRVSLPAGAPLVIDDVRPGFRMASATTAADPSTEQQTIADRADEYMPTGTEPGDWLLRQRCSDKRYRDNLYRRRTDPNVESINKYVDFLRTRQRGAFIPYVAPTYGGVSARLLTLFQDPGPKTDPAHENGSGMLCLENADFSAARAKFFLTQAGIDASEIISWNAYPWVKPHPQTEATDREAAHALHGFLGLIPQLDVVILNGALAKRIWGLTMRLHPEATAGVVVFSTFHPSPRLVNPAEKSADYINKVNKDIIEKYAAAGRCLRAT